MEVYGAYDLIFILLTYQEHLTPEIVGIKQIIIFSCATEPVESNTLDAKRFRAIIMKSQGLNEKEVKSCFAIVRNYKYVLS